MGLRIGLLVALFLASGCGSSLILDDDSAIVVTPLETGSDGHIFVPTMINGQGPFRFALDTGASISVLFDTTVERAGLSLPTEERVVIQGIAGAGAFPIASVAELTVGSESWTHARVAIMPAEDRATGQFDGILGVDFLRRYAIGVSASDRVVRLYAPELVSERAYRGWASIPMQELPIGEAGAIAYTIDLHINDIEIPSMLDLGAGSNLMNWHTARAIQINPRKAGGNRELTGAVETVAVTAELEVQRLWIGNVAWRNSVFVVSDFPIFEALQLDNRLVAIVGPNLFNERDFVIDFARMRMLIGGR